MEWVVKICVVLGAGALGGILNAILVDGGFKRGFKETMTNGQLIRRPGWVGNVFIGMIAGFIFWVFYGNLKSFEVEDILRQAVGSILAGSVGGRLIMKEAETRILASSKEDLTEALKEAVKAANPKDKGG